MVFLQKENCQFFHCFHFSIFFTRPLCRTCASTKETPASHHLPTSFFQGPFCFRSAQRSALPLRPTLLKHARAHRLFFLFCFFFLIWMCFESEARGSRRNVQPSPVPVRPTVKAKEKAQAKLRHLLPQKERLTVETTRSHPFRRGLTSTSEGSAKHLLPTFQPFQELIHTTNKRHTIETKKIVHSKKGTKVQQKPNDSHEQPQHPKETRPSLTRITLFRTIFRNFSLPLTRLSPLLSTLSQP